MAGGRGEGVIACEAALQRILDGKPFVSDYVGLDLSKLTASIVSHEAGFDRGYLKRSRKAHFAILARIEAARSRSDKVSTSSHYKRIEVMKNKIERLERELAIACEQRDRVLTQNLQLWNCVKGLEKVRPQLGYQQINKMT